MISFIHSGSEKRVNSLPSGNRLADARERSGQLYGSIVTI